MNGRLRTELEKKYSKKVRILRVAVPSERNVSLNKYIGKVLPFTGNAYHGFYVVLEDGSKVDAFHFIFKYVED